MPYSFNGFGTTYYGQCDFRADGSYVTTEWIIAALVPVFPLRSFRVLPMPKADKYYVVYSSEGFLLLENLPRSSRQVLAIYGFILLIAGWVWGVLSLIPRFGLSWREDATVFGIVFAILLIPMLALPSILRRRARRAIPFSEEALVATLDARGLLNADRGNAGALPPPLPTERGSSSNGPDNDDRYKPPTERSKPSPNP